MAGGLALTDYERREREAQRDAVARVLPDPSAGSVLRTSSGEVIVYEEQDEKRRPVNPRAVVMPDGETLFFETDRFGRG
jgi:hypothetical protein